MKLIKQEHRFSDEFSAGILTVNKDTLAEFSLMREQSRRNTASNIRSIAISIEENGYDLGKPLVLNSKHQTTDGYSRASAIIELIQSDRVKLIEASYLVTNSAPQAFNDTRGLDLSVVKIIFSRSKTGGTQAGACERAAEQAVEASKILDCKYMPFKKAHDPQRYQEHLVKIDNHHVEFSNAFDGVLQVFDGTPPAEYKFMHWLALFTRYGITATAINLCRNSTITNQESSSQQSRYESFLDLEEKLNSARAL